MGAEKETNKDAVEALAEDLLCKNWVESRPAIQGRERVEIFRGKDLLLYLREHADLVEGFRACIPPACVAAAAS